MRSVRVIGVSVVVLLTAWSAGHAHMGAQGVIKQRMDQMGSLKDAMKMIGEMLKADAEPKEKIVNEAAALIKAASGSHLVMLFPEGSLKAPSEATEAVWQKRAEFEALARRLEEGGNALAQSATGTRQDVVGAFTALSETCKSCHEQFRMKSN